MRHARLLGITALAATALAAGGYAYSQSSVSPLPENPPVETAPIGAAVMTDLAKTKWGDPKKGATLAATCAACHGVDGNPGDPQYPRIAGMPERYTAQQLALFKSNQRTGGMAAVMIPFATTLSVQDMRDVGAFFATQKAGAGVADDTEITQGPNKGMKFYQVGENLFRGGDPKRGIPACMACHGPSGDGNPGPAYPHVGGQQSAYVVRRLQEYRTGTTTEQNPALFNIMASIAKTLTDEEINSLGSYLNGLHPRSADAAQSASMAPAAAPAPAPEESGPAPTAAAASPEPAANTQ